nr:hypothetical protein [Microbispora sp. GKU 823]
MTTPTRALLTTSSAKWLRPSQARSSSRSSVALVTSTTGTCAWARRSRPSTSSSARAGALTNAVSSARACSRGTWRARAASAASIHCSTVICPSSAGRSTSGAKTAFAVVPSARPMARSSSVSSDWSWKRMTPSKSHSTASYGRGIVTAHAYHAWPSPE